MGKAPTGRCALCQSRTKLCESHILSDFLYEHTKDEDRQFISLSRDPRHPTRPMQKGYWEHLLCVDCEGRIGEWERVAADVLRLASETEPQDSRTVRVPGADTATLRLFFLSLLWRAHAARHDAVEAVRLGPYGEPLREMLMAGDPAEWWRFPVVVIRLDGSDVARRTIVPVTGFAKIWGKRSYRTIAFGFAWVFVISDVKRVLPDGLPALGSEKDLVIGRKEVDDRSFLLEMAGIARDWGKL